MSIGILDERWQADRCSLDEQVHRKRKEKKTFLSVPFHRANAWLVALVEKFFVLKVADFAASEITYLTTDVW